MSSPKVAILMGSKSDLPTVQPAAVSKSSSNIGSFARGGRK